jgi:hypothetical protein
VIGRDEGRLREGAAKGGLVLEKCGRRWHLRTSPVAGETRGRKYSVWLTRRFNGTEPPQRTAQIYEKLVQQYTAYSKFATHFVILRKSKKGERRRRTKRSSQLTG